MKNQVLDSLISENVYGHKKRLTWMLNFIEQSDLILEVGCGTGYMITRPLVQLGYSVQGLDLSEKSIEYGKKLFLKENLDPLVLHCENLKNFNGEFDTIIISEVLEHMKTSEIEEILDLIFSKLKKNGKILVTVPFGYGWAEFESWIWKRSGLKKWMYFFRLNKFIHFITREPKTVESNSLVKGTLEPLSTLDESPHIQKFNINRLRLLLEKHGFKVEHQEGGSLWCGPLTNALFKRSSCFMKLNNYLGSKFPRLASAFYLLGRKENLS